MVNVINCLLLFVRETRASLKRELEEKDSIIPSALYFAVTESKFVNDTLHYPHRNPQWTLWVLS